VPGFCVLKSDKVFFFLSVQMIFKIRYLKEWMISRILIKSEMMFQVKRLL